MISKKFSARKSQFSSKYFSLPFVANIGDILKVRIGEYDVTTTAEPLPHQVCLLLSFHQFLLLLRVLTLQEFNISDIKIHPNFNNATLVNDIALLKLERPAKRQQNIDVVCVASEEEIEESRLSNCYVTGWGRRTESEC